MAGAAPTLSLPDAQSRKTALTALDRSMLVEAGAGSGKTSILAGRIALLFASGVEPKHVAAITFTEFAASELLIRIDGFVHTLSAGTVPKDLAAAFPNGISPKQHDNLNRAIAAFDQLTCSTIHGFAQALVKPYPVEADIDPGARIIDPAEAELAFGEHLEAWLREHLSGNIEDDIVAQLVLADETAGLTFVRDVAAFMKSNRDARPGDVRWQKSIVRQFVKAVSTFRGELDGFEFREDETEGRLEAFAIMAKEMDLLDVGKYFPSNADLIKLLGVPTPGECFTAAGPRQLSVKGRWQAAAREKGKSKAEGEQAFGTASVHYARCHAAYQAAVGTAAAELLARLATAVDGLMHGWRQYKRAAALLDFDDLIYTARDLLAGHDQIRKALAKRFQHVLVDEFQDTDPLQIEILWRLCGEASAGRKPDPLARKLRQGALFLVGDPKQAIYRFRGADVNAYLAARESMGAKAVVAITANFRSVKPIIDFVNARFARPLSKEAHQPGFTALDATATSPKGALTVAALDVPLHAEKALADMLRDAEADRIAELCRRLIGSWTVRDPGSDTLRVCIPGDIALLAPVGTDLWRFEEALEDRGIPVSTQAGKGLFRRQEIQDLIALTRSLSDARDTLALGALLRGPLVGLTELELLDIAQQLLIDPNHPDRLPQLGLWTKPADVNHELARTVLAKLQALGRRARSTTPYILLADAVEALSVRAQLRQRYKAGADRALANVDLYLEMARAYDVRGLRAFARDMRANWVDATRQVEGRPDAAQQSVALITMHASKGLEWPIVVPINTSGTPRGETGVLCNRRDARFSVRVLGVEPPAYGALKAWNEEEQARERVRLWYVATTRARDLLILPRHSSPLKDKAWARVVDFDLASLTALDLDSLPGEMPPLPEAPDNLQTREVFANEAARIVQGQLKLNWHCPSRGESESPHTATEFRVFAAPEVIEETTPELAVEVAGSATRGTLLHKLIEEVLTGETADDVASLVNRANQLVAQLDIVPAADPKFGITPTELAETVLRTLNLPEIAELRRRLVPELSVYQCVPVATGETLISGIVDALVVGADGNIETVIDWKSDVDPNIRKLHLYRSQMEAYLKATNAARGLLVFMTSAKIVRLP
jgi:ATP-dependent helicase/nuclease subunit A